MRKIVLALAFSLLFVGSLQAGPIFSYNPNNPNVLVADFGDFQIQIYGVLAGGTGIVPLSWNGSTIVATGIGTLWFDVCDTNFMNCSDITPFSTVTGTTGDMIGLDFDITLPVGDPPVHLDISVGGPGTYKFTWIDQGEPGVTPNFEAQLDVVPTGPPVPEPASLALFGTGGLALLSLLRRRAKA